MKRLLPLLLVLGACSPLRASFVRDDWKHDDATQVKRLAVVVLPPMELPGDAAKAWARVARRYVNQKRDFLVKQEHADALATEVPNASVCGGDDAIEGVLRLTPRLQPKDGGFEVELTGTLQRCADGREAWRATAAGSFPSKDERLVEVTAIYVQEFGAAVEPFIAPAFNVLRPLLDTLPQPALTEADLDEKLTLD